MNRHHNPLKELWKEIFRLHGLVYLALAIASLALCVSIISASK